MSLSSPFIRRPVATTLLTFGLFAAGTIAFFKLPVSPLPDVDIPTISVQATLPGASPEDVATTVASPLERHLGQIADVTEMTSSSSLGSARVNLQFGINRDINGAARDVQAAINASRADLPTSLRSNPTYRKFNPAAAPILIYTLTSDTLMPAELYDAASTVLAQKLSQVEGVGEVSVSGGSLPAVRVELDAAGALQIRHRPGRRPRGARQRQCPQSEGRHRRRETSATRSIPTIRPSRRRTTNRWSSPIATARRCA